MKHQNHEMTNELFEDACKVVEKCKEELFVFDLPQSTFIGICGYKNNSNFFQSLVTWQLEKRFLFKFLFNDDYWIAILDNDLC
jgi:hypothetical protein